MDNPKITVQVSSHAAKPVVETTSIQEAPASFHTLPSRTGRSRDTVAPAWWQTLLQMKNMNILIPFTLATLTGVLLGICMLVLFRGQAGEAAVHPVPPATGTSTTTAQVQGMVDVQGISLYAWQVGVFQEKSAAENEQAKLKTQGVAAAIRGTGPYSLYAAVAPDKQAGAGLERLLKDRKVNYYAKPFPITARKGTITGLDAAGAKAAADSLNGALDLAHDVLLVALQTKPSAESVGNLQTQLAATEEKLTELEVALTKAAHPDQAQQVKALADDLSEAVKQLGQAQTLPAQGQLTAFFITYENLIGHLVNSQ
ncbi:MAG TPA: hypothetical protein VFV52_15030 [Bacilli bacterium]|nr:hypothetical protein [Bacilli bacterium]